MVADAAQLVAQRFAGHGVILRLPLAPLLPIRAAAPARHHHDALAVASLVKMVVHELAFQANGVEVQVADVAQLVVFARGGEAKQHILGPAAAADEDFLAVDVEDAMLLRVQFGGDAADAEIEFLDIGDLPADGEFQPGAIQVLRAQRIGPPELGILDRELRVIGGSERGDQAACGPQRQAARHGDVADRSFERPLDFAGGGIGAGRP